MELSCRKINSRKPGTEFSSEEVVKLENNIFNARSIPTTGLVCPRCGTTMDDYQRTSLVGCPVCYRFFRDQLTSSIRKVQFTLQHEGKFPAGTSPESRSRRRITILRHDLSEAVLAENFERAAQLRDEINDLTQLLNEESTHDR